MQLLQSMDISGYLYPAYGKLTLTYTFQNTADTPCAPRYFFPVPEDAILGGFQLLTKDKMLLQGSFSSITDSHKFQGDYRLFQVKPSIYCLSFEELCPNETCTILLEVLVRLFPIEHFCRFVFPHYDNTPMTVNLALHGMMPQSSISSFDPEEKALSVTLSGVEDFVLDCSVIDKCSTAVLEESFGGGLGFYRLYTNCKFQYQTSKPMTLLLDWTEISSSVQINQIKELTFRLFSAMPASVPINIPALFEDTIFSTEETCQKVFEKLQSLTDSYDIERLQNTDKDIPTILVTGNPSSSLAPANWENLHLLTVGEHMPQKSTIHFYPKDFNEGMINAVLPSLLAVGQAPEVIPKGSNVRELFLLSNTTLAGNGYIDLVLSYTGQAPHSFTLQKEDEILETITLENISPMPHFPDVQKLYATGKTNHLSILLKKVSPSSLRMIKRQLAETCLRYQILGSETVLTLDTGLNTYIHLPVYSFDSLPRASLPTKQKTIFGESLRNLPEENRWEEYCLTVLYQNVRKNGGIFSFDTLIPEKQGEETALSAMALHQQDDTHTVLSDAYEFLETVPDCRWHFLLRKVREGKPMMEEVFKLLPAPEELLALLKEKPFSVKYAAMLLLQLKK